MARASQQLSTPAYWLGLLALLLACSGNRANEGEPGATPPGPGDHVDAAVLAQRKPAQPAKPAPASVRQPERVPTVCPAALRTGLDRADALGNAGLGVHITDPAHNLDRFFRRWVEVALAKRGAPKLRVAIYGDSNVARDWAAGLLRQLWGEQLGFGGHGYIGAGPPDAWYQHRGIRTLRGDGWRTYAASEPPSPDGIYGHGALFSLGTRPGAWASWHSANGIESPALANEHFSAVEVQYLCEPQGGAFELFVDGISRRVVTTRCDKPDFRRARLTVSAGKHDVKLVVTQAPVSVFGAVFERDTPGLVIDNLGVNSANLFHLLKIDEALFAAGMKSRGYDLVILAGATSMTPSLAHRLWAAKFIRRLRSSLGEDVSVVIFSQAPYGEKRGDQIVARPEIAKLARDDRRIAKDNRIAFWDYHAAMGGDAALPHLVARRLLYADMLHSTPFLHRVMMLRFARETRRAFYAYLARRKWPCRPARKPATRRRALKLPIR